MHKSGTIWSKSYQERTREVREVCEALERLYGKPRLGNPEDPLDDLLYIIISNKTGTKVAKRIYAQAKRRFPTWENLLSAPEGLLYSTLKPAGLATVKSKQIREAIRKIKDDFGEYSLASLARKSPKDIREYLISLSGVSDKVAKCVMLFTMDRNVLPVDSHVHRIAKRLGWTLRKRADQCHEELESLVPPKRRYAFHGDCIIHGRQVCRPTDPECEKCMIGDYCEYAVKDQNDRD